MKPSDQISITSYSGSVNTEIASDYILPDTYPDVKKVLRVESKPIIIGRYISGRKLELTGAVDYAVIFSADGESGESLHCVHFAGEWESAVSDISSLEGVNITVVPRVSACTQRLANPRKLSLKSTVTSDIKVTAPLPCAPACEGAQSAAEQMQLEKLTKTVESRRECTFLADPLRISENLEPDAAQPAIDEIISCSSSICFHEAKINRDGDFTVSLKGEALIDCIYKSQGEAGVYKSFSRKCPVAYIVGAAEYENQFANCRPESLLASADATTVEISASVGENSYGERRVVELDMSADVTVCIVGSEDAELVLDAYSLIRDCECVKQEFDCESTGKVLFANFSVGESANRAELNIPEASAIIDTAADVSINDMSIERGRAVFTGAAAISCIYENGGEYMSSDVNIPIKCEINVGDIAEPLSYTCFPRAYDMRARLDPERIFFDFEVSLCMQICERRHHSSISAIRLLGEAREVKPSSCMTLCYPGEKDTLWNIAKRYNTTVSALEAANNTASRVLMIPQAPRGIII